MTKALLFSAGLLALGGFAACEVHDNTINATANIPDAKVSVTADTDVDNVEAAQPIPMTVKVENVYLVEPTVTTVPAEHEKDAGHLVFHLDDETKPPLLVTASTTVQVPIPADTKPGKHKVISRAVAYHGTPHGALSITGLPALKAPFEPLVPSAFRVPNTNLYRASDITAGLLDGSDPEAFGRWAADQVGLAIEYEGPDTVAAVFLEPVQNAGGCFPPPPGYWQRVREICDHYDVLLVSDEVICAYGRLGELFGAERYGYVPDIITSAKGMTSGYAPMGAMIAKDELMEPFLREKAVFLHGYTWGGHPVGAAVALANLDAFERDAVLTRARAMLREGHFPFDETGRRYPWPLV